MNAMKILRSRRLVLVFLFLPTLVAGSVVAWAEQLRTDTSLRWAPASASFYMCSLRMADQWKVFQDSKAYALLKEMPLVQMVAGQLQAKWQEADGPVEQVRDFVSDPENANLMKLLCDLISHEVFVYGDEGVGKLIYELNRINRISSRAQMEMLKEDDVDAKELARKTIDVVIEGVAGLGMPNIVFGCKTSEPELARAELARLAKLVGDAVATEELFKDRFQERQFGNSGFLQLTIDKDLIPWEAAMKDKDIDPAQIQRLQEELKGKEMRISLGLHGDYVLLAIGADENPLEMLAKSQLLIDVDEFTQLRKLDASGKHFTSVAYASGEFMKQVSRPKEDIDQAVSLLQALLPRAGLDKDLESDLSADIAALAEDIKALIPEASTVLGYEFLTSDGYEGYVQNWSQNLYLDGSKPLDILKHVGGNPLLVVALREKKSEDSYLKLGKWMGKLCSYGERFATMYNADEDALKLYRTFRDELAPLVQQMGKVTQDKLVPAMKDGQVAFVIDAKLEPKEQWHVAMPPADQPLPMLEFAEVYGVSDVASLEDAFEQYRDVAQKFIDKLKQLTADHQEKLMDKLEGPAQSLPVVIQNAQLPTPNSHESEHGKLYYLAFLQQLGVDEAIAPAIGWCKNALILSNSAETVDRLLADQAVGGALKQHAHRNLASASYMDFAGLVDVVQPWITYGMKLVAQQQENPTIGDFVPQVESLLDLLKCFRTYSSVTFVEKDSLVTHYQAKLGDVE
jgi:hypothetical protein